MALRSLIYPPCSWFGANTMASRATSSLRMQPLSSVYKQNGEIKLYRKAVLRAPLPHFLRHRDEAVTIQYPFN